MKKKITLFTALLLLVLTITSFATYNYTPYTYNTYNADAIAINSVSNTLSLFLTSFLWLAIILCLFSFIVSILLIICNCLIFDMAGEKWWKALIPIYNSIVLCKIIGLSPYWLFLLLTSFIPIVGYIVVLTLSIVMQVKLAKAFGKGVGFALGLIFLSPIFMAILAFGSSTYVLGDIKEQNDFFGTPSDSSNKNSKKEEQDPSKKYIIVDEEGEEVDPRMYEPMDLTDYKPKSDFFNN